ncbi:DMT family transporter [Thermoflexus sp.]|uniref:DMT family transporter n=1 Tax=Thermoflexus sp. TaxID=1969742 RepID=UPI00260002EC|nr:DMT family transporter [Thermoflexus sp.]MCS7350340.1 DMT family transporter [Thermoflexus sp.]MCX7689815.1 DMT family transporter [Thermoflexus sp.]MDW8179791.1 DMT family transporter [Anaerolineae bacterium]MDW8183697.1 DMT family transporter [Anaerolineae bacterium]
MLPQEPRHALEWQGILAALFSAMMLGGAPILAKLAYQAGADPTAVVILRTGLAALALWALYLIHPHWRRYLYIYPVGLLGCLAVGFTNALGSVFYYLGLYRLDAAVAHLIYSMYPILVALMIHLNGEPIPGLTRLRMFLASLGLVFLLGRFQGTPDLFGVLLMLLSSVFYALHVVLSQRVLYEMPAQTMTLYALTAMAAFTPVAGWVFGNPRPPVPSSALGPIFAMAAVLMFSRLGMFMGVKRLGGTQTALLTVTEILVTVALAVGWLGEHLTPIQWVGASLMVASIMLVIRESPRAPVPRWRMPLLPPAD